jgi:START domain
MLRFMIFCWLPMLAFAQPDCNLKRDRDGIRVYTCREANDKFKSLRAEFELTHTTAEELKNFLWNVSNYKTWQYNTLEADTVGVFTPNQLTYRALVDAPWPVDNREMIARMTTHQTPNGLNITIRTYPYSQPPPDGVIRVPFFEANWTIVTQGAGLKLTYALRIDPGGSVPAWLVNIAMADGPHVSFKNLKTQLER